jgi:hypothetical protein
MAAYRRGTSLEQVGPQEITGPLTNARSIVSIGFALYESVCYVTLVQIAVPKGGLIKQGWALPTRGSAQPNP